MVPGNWLQRVLGASSVLHTSLIGKYKLLDHLLNQADLLFAEAPDFLSLP